MVRKASTISLQQLLREWDHGKTKTREKILSNFIERHKDDSGPDLEEEFADAGSLFLTRITTWLRLTYLLGGNIKIQLDAIKVFLSASCGQRYLSEFLEVGGILTVLEILGLKTAKEEDKAAAMQLLETISNCGRKYKEVICESYGVRAAAECMARSYTAETQECGRSLLYSLAHGNPRFQKQVYQVLKDLLPSTNPGTQRVAAQGLRHIQKLIGSPTHALVENVLALLRSLYSDVQYEASELLKELVGYEEVRVSVVGGLVTLLTPTLDDVTKPALSDTPLPQHLQQAAAAKVLGLMCDSCPKLATLAVEEGAVQGLIVVLSNVRHPPAQQHAARTLAGLVARFSEVHATLGECLGDDLIQEFLKAPEDIHKKLTPAQLDKLISNNTQVELQLGSSDDEDVNEATKSYEENLKNLSAEEIAVQ